MAIDLAKVGPTGYGSMKLTWNPKPPSQEQAFGALKAALNSGCIYWNAGEFYGPPERNSCHLLKEYFTKYPEDASKVILNIKGGLQRGGMLPDGSPENVRQSVNDCLEMLGGTKKIDIFECARKDPNVEIETTMEALAELVKEGKIGAIALSEVGSETIRRAAKIYPIVTVEVELSLWSPDILQNGIAATCAELGIPVTAYSPLARGGLGRKLDVSEFAPGDFRLREPRYQAEALEKNNQLTEEVMKLADRKGCTPAQVAISWVRQLSGRNGLPVIVPIPGAQDASKVEENAKHIQLSEEELKEIDGILTHHTMVGDRYGGFAAKFMNG